MPPSWTAPLSAFCSVGLSAAPCGLGALSSSRLPPIELCGRSMQKDRRDASSCLKSALEHSRGPHNEARNNNNNNNRASNGVRRNDEVDGDCEKSYESTIGPNRCSFYELDLNYCEEDVDNTWREFENVIDAFYTLKKEYEAEAAKQRKAPLKQSQLLALATEIGDLVEGLMAAATRTAEGEKYRLNPFGKMPILASQKEQIEALCPCLEWIDRELKKGLGSKGLQEQELRVKIDRVKTFLHLAAESLLSSLLNLTGKRVTWKAKERLLSRLESALELADQYEADQAQLARQSAEEDLALMMEKLVAPKPAGQPPKSPEQLDLDRLDDQHKLAHRAAALTKAEKVLMLVAKRRAEEVQAELSSQEGLLSDEQKAELSQAEAAIRSLTEKLAHTKLPDGLLFTDERGAKFVLASSARNGAKLARVSLARKLSGKQLSSEQRAKISGADEKVLSLVNALDERDGMAKFITTYRALKAAQQEQANLYKSLLSVNAPAAAAAAHQLPDAPQTPEVKSAGQNEETSKRLDEAQQQQQLANHPPTGLQSSSGSDKQEKKAPKTKRWPSLFRRASSRQSNKLKPTDKNKVEDADGPSSLGPRTLESEGSHQNTVVNQTGPQRNSKVEDAEGPASFEPTTLEIETSHKDTQTRSQRDSGVESVDGRSSFGSTTLETEGSHKNTAANPTGSQRNCGVRGADRRSSQSSSSEGAPSLSSKLQPRPKSGGLDTQSQTQRKTPPPPRNSDNTISPFQKTDKESNEPASFPVNQEGNKSAQGDTRPQTLLETQSQTGEAVKNDTEPLTKTKTLSSSDLAVKQQTTDKKSNRPAIFSVNQEGNKSVQGDTRPQPPPKPVKGNMQSQTLLETQSQTGESVKRDTEPLTKEKTLSSSDLAAKQQTTDKKSNRPASFSVKQEGNKLAQGDARPLILSKPQLPPRKEDKRDTLEPATKDKTFPLSKQQTTVKKSDQPASFLVNQEDNKEAANKAFKNELAQRLLQGRPKSKSQQLTTAEKTDQVGGGQTAGMKIEAAQQNGEIKDSQQNGKLLKRQSFRGLPPRTFSADAHREDDYDEVR